MPSSPKLSETEVRRFEKYYRQGYSDTSVAEAMGITTSRVTTYRRKRKLPRLSSNVNARPRIFIEVPWLLTVPIVGVCGE